MLDLARFESAQEQQPWTRALGELEQGAKRTHWIWWVFPQLAALGSSNQAQYFGLDGIEEAEAYLRAEVLAGRLVDCLDALLKNRGRGLVTVMGGNASWDVDTLKLVSCATLFREASVRTERADVLQRCDAVLAWAFEEGYPPCVRTLELLRGR